MLQILFDIALEDGNRFLLAPFRPASHGSTTFPRVADLRLSLRSQSLSSFLVASLRSFLRSRHTPNHNSRKVCYARTSHTPPLTAVGGASLRTIKGRIAPVLLPASLSVRSARLLRWLHYVPRLLPLGILFRSSFSPGGRRLSVWGLRSA